ncbi:hypothetical protein BSKO_10595 [Bryopsis sp. KO-2023]|nr:hypothetical protein BSKO_10595 [Bryopsis sp. KO-2023]
MRGCIVGSHSFSARFGAIHVPLGSASSSFSSKARWPAVGGRSSRKNRCQVKAMSSQAASELPANLKNIVGAFQMVPDPMARYKQLLYFASKLDSLPSQHHTEENKVHGCVSQVWVKATMSDGKVSFQAESDSQLTKGLAALLVQGLSGSSPQEILALQPDFIEMLGLKQSLTPSRNNGFLNMFKLMQRKTLEVAAQSIKAEEASNEGSSEEVASSSGNGNGNGSQPASKSPVRDSIVRKLTEGLAPTSLDVIDQSAQHANHMAMKGHDGSGETHFRVEIASQAFDGLNAVKRHRLVFDLLKEEMAGPVHALSLDTKLPEQVS